MAGIYIHIPFCKQACNYCNFYFSTSTGNKNRYLEALLREIELTKDYLEGESVETLYLGGGTPSILTADEIKMIVEQLGRFYTLRNLREFTLETNPDDLTPAKVQELQGLKSIGLNRFSIGVQSFFEDDLRYMNRAHNAHEGLSSIRRVQDAGFENITVDLIYGTPGMTDENWMKNLQTVFELKVPHISSYALTVEPRTALESKIKKRQLKPVSEEQSATQFKILMKEMDARGYEQYEISNFARPGSYAVHNTNYWLGHKYLGLGPSAHSFNRSARRWNVANNVNYIEGIAKGNSFFEEEILTAVQITNERIMTSIRTMWGLNLSELTTDDANSVVDSLRTVNPYYYTLKNNILKLTPEGKLFADGIAADLFLE